MSVLQHNIRQFENQIYEYLNTINQQQIAEKLKKIMEDFPTDLTASMTRQSMNSSTEVDSPSTALIKSMKQ